MILAIAIGFGFGVLVTALAAQPRERKRKTITVTCAPFDGFNYPTSYASASWSAVTVEVEPATFGVDTPRARSLAARAAIDRALL